MQAFYSAQGKFLQIAQTWPVDQGEVVCTQNGMLGRRQVQQLQSARTVQENASIQQCCFIRHGKEGASLSRLRLGVADHGGQSGLLRKRQYATQNTE